MNTEFEETPDFPEAKPEFKIPYIYFIGVVIFFCAVILFLSVENNNLTAKNTELKATNNFNEVSAAMMYNKYWYSFESRQPDANLYEITEKQLANVWHLMELLDDKKVDELTVNLKACYAELDVIEQNFNNADSNESKKLFSESYQKKTEECGNKYFLIEDRIYELMKPRYEKYLVEK